MTNAGSRISWLMAAGLTAALGVACGGGGGSGPPTSAGADNSWVIDPELVVDGGPGKDGIPALDDPVFGPITENQPDVADDLVIAVRIGDEVKVYPHDILDWHEIVNDGIPSNPVIVSYCPLTGSAVAWKGDPTHGDPTFGVSGQLYNSNLLPYDRETDSLWSQMLEISVNGPRVRARPDRVQLIEMTWATAREMFPGAVQLTRDTGHNRNYDRYPYGSYRSSNELLFPVQNDDNRLHRKTRVIGIYSTAGESRVYQVDGFGGATRTINDQFDGRPVVAVGNSSANFAAIYSRELDDGTILNFLPLDDALPNVMTDDEGNVWDIFGTATSGPRAGAQLGLTSSYTAYWFAWAAFFVNAEIHFN